ncbi:TRAP transporter small permease subunit [Desulfobacula sp.]|uniref:TRAP transporter small permease subunit n=1 Tax=Desulfobacula sp. TaxID=2593537 RepID=UPI001ED01E71|nr:TRAP transporter small permease subunit [Desulfobacula sp.]
MESVKKAVLFCDRINEWIGSFIVAPAVFIFILVIFSNVVLRYAFNTSFVFMAELEWHVFAFIFLMGAGYTLLHEGHVRVDIFYSLMDRKKQAFINLFGVLFLLIPSCYVVLTTTIPWVIVAYKVGEVSIDPGGIPARFLLKATLPVGYFLMLIQGLLLCVRSAFILLGKPLEDEP